MRRRYAGFAAIGLVVVLATASYASAAHLDLRGASLTTTSAGHPCPGTLAATTPTTPTPTTAVSTVTVTAPAACAGRTLHIAVNSGGTVVEGTAQAPASGSVIVHLDGSYVPTASTTVAATVSSWGLPTTWSYTPPNVPAIRCYTGDVARPCAATVVVRDSWATGYNLDITITDTRANGNNPVPWTIELDFSNATFPFVPNALDGSGVVPAANACQSNPVMTFTGVTNWGEHHMLRRDSTRTVWIQARNDGMGAVLDCVP